MRLIVHPSSSHFLPSPVELLVRLVLQIFHRLPQGVQVYPKAALLVRLVLQTPQSKLNGDVVKCFHCNSLWTFPPNFTSPQCPDPTSRGPLPTVPNRTSSLIRRTALENELILYSVSLYDRCSSPLIAVPGELQYKSQLQGGTGEYVQQIQSDYKELLLLEPYWCDNGE